MFYNETLQELKVSKWYFDYFGRNVSGSDHTGKGYRTFLRISVQVYECVNTFYTSYSINLMLIDSTVRKKVRLKDRFYKENTFIQTLPGLVKALDLTLFQLTFYVTKFRITLQIISITFHKVTTFPKVFIRFWLTRLSVLQYGLSTSRSLTYYWTQTGTRCSWLPYTHNYPVQNFTYLGFRSDTFQDGP